MKKKTEEGTWYSNDIHDIHYVQNSWRRVRIGIFLVALQSWTKMLWHFTKSPLFHPLPPVQCCQCWYVVKTKLDELQTPWNNIEQGGGGNEYSLPAGKSLHMQKMCDIHLSQLVLSKVVAFIQSLMFWSLLSWSDPLQPQASSWWT